MGACDGMCSQVGAVKSVLTNPGDQIAPSSVSRYSSAIDAALGESVVVWPRFVLIRPKSLHC